METKKQLFPSMPSFFQNKPTASARTGAFLDLVVKRGDDAWPVMIKALRSTKQSSIARILENELQSGATGGQVSKLLLVEARPNDLID